ncbi:hypothetical protein L1275_003013 [Flavobacterium sp. HSC-61S13]|nr:hypothetical protein [Flavobacterium sp. HSC-61S13]
MLENSTDLIYFFSGIKPFLPAFLERNLNKFSLLVANLYFDKKKSLNAILLNFLYLSIKFFV